MLCCVSAASTALAKEPPKSAPKHCASFKGALNTASGLTMEVLARGHGKAHPQANDCVRLRFIVWSSDGTVFARSSLDGSPNTECVRRLTLGVAEAVRAMVVGEQRRVWVPAHLNTAIDAANELQAAPPALTYEITLVDVIKAPPTPSPLLGSDPRARKLPSGLALKVLSKGSGSVHPSITSKVMLHLSGWTTDGALFESTLMTGQTASFEVQALLPGLREGVQAMVEGERVRLWIPAALAYGNGRRRRGQPAGPLVYDVELRAIENAP
jgi:FKBP-type peptidyl-prolyl cis-trans isomerase